MNTSFLKQGKFDASELNSFMQDSLRKEQEGSPLRAPLGHQMPRRERVDISARPAGTQRQQSTIEQEECSMTLYFPELIESQALAN